MPLPIQHTAGGPDRLLRTLPGCHGQTNRQALPLLQRNGKAQQQAGIQHCSGTALGRVGQSLPQGPEPPASQRGLQAGVKKGAGPIPGDRQRGPALFRPPGAALLI